MSHLKAGAEFFVLRTSKSLWYQSPNGSKTPILYSKRGATTALRNKVGSAVHPTDGKWEMVPVTLTFGEPLKDTK